MPKYTIITPINETDFSQLDYVVVFVGYGMETFIEFVIGDTHYIYPVSRDESFGISIDYLQKIMNTLDCDEMEVSNLELACPSVTCRIFAWCRSWKS